MQVSRVHGSFLLLPNFSLLGSSISENVVGIVNGKFVDKYLAKQEIIFNEEDMLIVVYSGFV